MTNSNDRNNLAADQTDDLIAELARIVADDAKQASVSKSVDERAQLAADAREQQSYARSFEQQQEIADAGITSAGDSAEAERVSIENDVLPFDQRDVPVPFSQVGSGVTSIRNEPAPVEAKDAPKESSPFEFDFSHNIKMGVSRSSPAMATPTVDEAYAEQPSFDAVDDPSAPDALDSIAAIIEDVERQFAEPETEAFDPIPVAHVTQPENEPELESETPLDDFRDEPDVNDEQQDFQYIPQQNMHVPDGDDEFAVPPSMDSARLNTSSEVDDPLTEIEKLIADTNTPNTAPDPKPADAAEAAILAALASASGSRPEMERSPVSAARASASQKMEPRFEPATPTARDHVAPAHQEHIRPERDNGFADIETRRRGGFLPIIASVAAIVLLAVVGGVGYWFFVGQSVEGQDIPVVAAQNTEVKETPEATVGETDGSSVFDALEGNAEPTAQEQIVSRDETGGASGTDVARVVTPNSTSNGLTNRKVKTVTVLADGTIVSGTEASAGAEQLPQDVRPNAPTVAVDVSDPASDEIANVLNAIKEGTEVVPQPPAADTIIETTEPQQDVAVSSDPSAPVPPSRPSGLGTGPAPSLAAPVAPIPTNTVEQPISLLPTASSSPTPAPANNNNAATSAGVDAPFYVQLASQRSIETAQSTAASLQRRFSSDLANQTIDINQVDLGERGIFFRVRVPANSLADANALCSSLKANGGDCFVRNN